MEYGEHHLKFQTGRTPNGVDVRTYLYGVFRTLWRDVNLISEVTRTVKVLRTIGLILCSTDCAC